MLCWPTACVAGIIHCLLRAYRSRRFSSTQNAMSNLKHNSTSIHHFATDHMFLSPQHVLGWNSNSTIMVFWGGEPGKWAGQEDGALMKEISIFMKRSGDLVQLFVQKQGLSNTTPAGGVVLNFPAPENDERRMHSVAVTPPVWVLCSCSPASRVPME